MSTFLIPTKTFYDLSYARLGEIAQRVYCTRYDAHEGLLRDKGPHTFRVTTDEPSEYAQEELDKFVNGTDYHPHPLVLLSDLAHRGAIPGGSYLFS